MFRKRLLPLFFLLIALGRCAQAEPEQNITMLVVPRDAKAIQVAQQVSTLYPTLIVSYQQFQNMLKLYAWNGEGWVDVPVEDYVNGVFFANPPQHTILVEHENSPAPDILVPNGIWCKTGNRLTSTDPRVMIHLIGRHLNFPYRHWMHFSKKYKLPLEAINPGLINVYWWHYRGDQIFPALEARDLEVDMDKWLYLDIAPPLPVEPVPENLKEIAEIIEDIRRTNAVETAKPAEPAPVADPFSNAEIPAAEVVLPPAE